MVSQYEGHYCRGVYWDDVDTPDRAELSLRIGEANGVLTRPHYVLPAGALSLRQTYTKTNCQPNYHQECNKDKECQSLPSSSFSYLWVISKTPCSLSTICNRSTSPYVHTVTKLSGMFLTLP